MVVGASQFSDTPPESAARNAEPRRAKPMSRPASRTEWPLHSRVAMRFREFRRLLRQVVLAGLPLGTGCIAEQVISGGDECVKTVRRTIPVSLPTDPPLQLKIEGCRVDVDACGQVCEMVMQRAGL